MRIRCFGVRRRPGGSLSGATEDLPASLEALRGVIGTRAKGATLASAMIAPASVTETLSKTFTRVFDMGVRVPTRRVPRALGVVFIAGRVAMVSVMVALSESVCVPIGYAANDETLVRRVAELSGIGELVREGTRLWPQPAPSTFRPSDRQFQVKSNFQLNVHSADKADVLDLFRRQRHFRRRPGLRELSSGNRVSVELPIKRTPSWRH